MTALLHHKAFDAVGAAPWSVRLSVNPSFQNHSVSQRESLRDKTMNSTRGNLARTVLVQTAPDSSDEADVIFISDWARRLSAKEGARQTGMTAKGFQKLQQGENAISYKRLTQWLKTNPDFAADYAAHVGLILPGEAASASAFTRAVNAFQRRQG